MSVRYEYLEIQFHPLHISICAQSEALSHLICSSEEGTANNSAGYPGPESNEGLLGNPSALLSSSGACW